MVHMCVSALSGFITGGVMNSIMGNDVKSMCLVVLVVHCVPLYCAR